MGIQDRDYYREGSRSLLDAWGRQSAVLWLIAITSVLFFLPFLMGGGPRNELIEFGKYSYKGIASGEVWRLFTPIFIQTSPWRLLFNVLALYWAGSRVEAIYGSPRTILFYCAAGIFANAMRLCVQGFDGDLKATPGGAGSAVTALLVLSACHFPTQRVPFLPVPIWGVAILFVAQDLIGAAPGVVETTLLADLAGILFGYLYHQSHVRFSGLRSHSPRKIAREERPTLRLMPIEPEGDTAEPVGAAVESPARERETAEEHLEVKLDRVLEKVSKLGQESLSSEEREILVKASELYKKRRK
jgi:membrane associated rhomboid family serine protease